VEVVAFSSDPEPFDTSILKMSIKRLIWLDGKVPLLGRALAGARLPRNILLRLGKAVKDFNVVHVSENFHFFSFNAALMAGKRKFAFTQDENIPYPLFQHNPITWFAKQYVNKRADLIITTTEAGKRALIHEAVDDRKIRILPNSIDTALFTPSQKDASKVNLPEGLNETFNILFVGKINIQKGVPWLLQAFYKLRKRYSDMRLILVGKNYLPTEFLSRFIINQKGVHYIPWLPYLKMPGVYNLSDVVILPSVPMVNNEEQFGMAVLEAMACAKPSIVTDIGGLPWVVKRGRTSLIIPYKNASAIQRAVLKLYHNHELRRKMGEYSREYVKRRFSKETVGERLYEIYKEFFG